MPSIPEMPGQLQSQGDFRSIEDYLFEISESFHQAGFKEISDDELVILGKEYFRRVREKVPFSNRPGQGQQQLPGPQNPQNQARTAAGGPVAQAGPAAPPAQNAAPGAVQPPGTGAPAGPALPGGIQIPGRPSPQKALFPNKFIGGI